MNAFGVESTTALAQANAALNRARLPEVADPPSTPRMLAILRRVRARFAQRPGQSRPRG